MRSLPLAAYRSCAYSLLSTFFSPARVSSVSIFPATCVISSNSAKWKPDVGTSTGMPSPSIFLIFSSVGFIAVSKFEVGEGNMPGRDTAKVGEVAGIKG